MWLQQIMEQKGLIVRDLFVLNMEPHEFHVRNATHTRVQGIVIRARALDTCNVAGICVQNGTTIINTGEDLTCRQCGWIRYNAGTVPLYDWYCSKCYASTSYHTNGKTDPVYLCSAKCVREFFETFRCQMVTSRGLWRLRRNSPLPSLYRRKNTSLNSLPSTRFCWRALLLWGSRLWCRDVPLIWENKFLKDNKLKPKLS